MAQSPTARRGIAASLSVRELTKSELAQLGEHQQWPESQRAAGLCANFEGHDFRRRTHFILLPVVSRNCDSHHCASMLVVLKANCLSPSGSLIVYVNFSCLKVRVAPSSRC